MRNQFRAWTLNPGGITNEVSGGLRTSSAKGFVRRIIGHAVNLWQGPYRATAVMAGEGTDWSCVQTNVSSCVQPVTQPRRRANTVALGPYHVAPMPVRQDSGLCQTDTGLSALCERLPADQSSTA